MSTIAEKIKQMGNLNEERITPMKFIKKGATRLLLSAGLLYLVWTNSHWSVALSLTLIIIALEIQAFTNLVILDIVKLVQI